MAWTSASAASRVWMSPLLPDPSGFWVTFSSDSIIPSSTVEITGWASRPLPLRAVSPMGWEGSGAAGLRPWPRVGQELLSAMGMEKKSPSRGVQSTQRFTPCRGVHTKCLGRPCGARPADCHVFEHGSINALVKQTLECSVPFPKQ